MSNRLTCVTWGDDVVPCSCGAPEWVCKGWRHEPYSHGHVVDIGTVIDSEALIVPEDEQEGDNACHDANASQHGDTQPSTTGGITLRDELWNRLNDGQQRLWLELETASRSPWNSSIIDPTSSEHGIKVERKE
ncbi:hypothetical protein SEA_CHERRYONLIM_69 [Gordonia phage CherryonLim]|uniref:Uncharacterized protein n=1 Tax=Gordonia phage CherryonLim TaxID=2652411 RepID=A0A5P8DBL7_9CAUD|nr:hypothetical protein PP994_gp69 [Gordonia phage CherryonLim]QFP95822.1 hypothetical protein SEA_CHERRYONLIM_69 [Gordonia phage CherryonLim]